MKFSEMPYTRPDYAAAAKELDSLPAGRCQRPGAGGPLQGI